MYVSAIGLGQSSGFGKLVILAILPLTCYHGMSLDGHRCACVFKSQTLQFRLGNASFLTGNSGIFGPLVFAYGPKTGAAFLLFFQVGVGWGCTSYARLSHAQTCDNVPVQSATQWAASVHTLHMPKHIWVLQKHIVS